jgi:hypothetical protein
LNVSSLYNESFRGPELFVFVGAFYHLTSILVIIYSVMGVIAYETISAFRRILLDY